MLLTLSFSEHWVCGTARIQKSRATEAWSAVTITSYRWPAKLKLVMIYEPKRGLAYPFQYL